MNLPWCRPRQVPREAAQARSTRPYCSMGRLLRKNRELGKPSLHSSASTESTLSEIRFVMSCHAHLFRLVSAPVPCVRPSFLPRFFFFALFSAASRSNPPPPLATFDIGLRLPSFARLPPPLSPVSSFVLARRPPPLPGRPRLAAPRRRRRLFSPASFFGLCSAHAPSSSTLLFFFGFWFAAPRVALFPHYLCV